MRFFITLVSFALLFTSALASLQTFSQEVKRSNGDMLNKRSVYGTRQTFLAKRSPDDHISQQRAVAAHIDAAHANRNAAVAHQATADALRVHAQGHADAGRLGSAAQASLLAHHHDERAQHFHGIADQHEHLTIMGSNGPLRTNHEQHIRFAQQSTALAHAGHTDAYNVYNSIPHRR